MRASCDEVTGDTEDEKQRICVSLFLSPFPAVHFTSLNFIVQRSVNMPPFSFLLSYKEKVSGEKQPVRH